MRQDEDLIRQIVDIESQAQAIEDAAAREEAQLPIRAQQEAEALLRQARVEAEAEAQRIVSQARADDGSARLLAATEVEVGRMEATAKDHLAQAVSYVLAQIIGRN